MMHPTPRALVEGAFIAEAVILALSLAVFFGHAWLAQRRERRWRVRLQKGRRALLAVVRAGRANQPDVAVLAALPVRAQIRLFTEIVPSLAGQSRGQLGRLAREIGLVPAAERMAGARGWRDRLQGVRLLAAVGGGEGVVPPLLDDPHPAVRAGAVEWVALHHTPELVERLMRLLTRTDRYGSFVVRDSLLRIGADAVGPLARYLERHGGRHAAPALDVAARLDLYRRVAGVDSDPAARSATGAAATLRAQVEPGWAFTGSVGASVHDRDDADPLGRGGDPAGSLRGSGSVAYQLAPGRRVVLHGVFANAGVSQLASGAGAGYRYRALGLSGLWTF